MTSKSDRKRALILRTALQLFEKQGYERTTMRAIARKADVAQGAAYYYFRSKQELLFAFFEQRAEGSAARAAEICAATPLLHERFQRLARWKLARIAPHRGLFRALYPLLMAPDSGLSPFSTTTGAIREREIAAFGLLVDGALPEPGPDLTPYLPRLLWLAWMGMLLYWHHDSSTEQRRSELLLAHGAQLLGGLMLVAGTPLMEGLLALLQGLELESG